MARTAAAKTRHDIGLLDDRVQGKGTAFMEAERGAHGLEGLLPPTVETTHRQLERVMDHLGKKPSDLERRDVRAWIEGLAHRPGYP